jgi:hypothetical protein
MSVENPYFDQSRISNMSAYAQNNGELSNRGARGSLPASVSRPASSKVVSLIASHEFRPFSKPRKSKNIALQDMAEKGGMSRRSHNHQWQPTSTIQSVRDSSSQVEDDDDSNDEPQLTHNV